MQTNMDLKKFAQSLPYPVKQPIRYIYGTIPLSIRYGEVFQKTYTFLQESQWWSREKLREYQMHRNCQFSLGIHRRHD
jgi:phenylacetate-CoA ligase